MNDGSPPLPRRARGAPAGVAAPRRLTSARAESTVRSCRARCPCSAHLRSRGEYKFGAGKAGVCAGSPPLARRAPPAPTRPVVPPAYLRSRGKALPTGLGRRPKHRVAPVPAQEHTIRLPSAPIVTGSRPVAHGATITLFTFQGTDVEATRHAGCRATPTRRRSPKSRLRDGEGRPRNPGAGYTSLARIPLLEAREGIAVVGIPRKPAGHPRRVERRRISGIRRRWLRRAS